MQPFKIVDLFAGPGGLDVAARQLDIDAVGIEWDDDACMTREASKLDTVHADVRDRGPSDFADATVLAGGPPCQTFTVAGGGDGRRDLDLVLEFAARLKKREPAEQIKADLSGLGDERTGLVLEPLRWALKAIDAGKPYRAIVLEQVPAVLPVWQEYAEILGTEGYSVAPPAVLRTEEFGVPQTRRRAILIARRTNDPALSEKPTMPNPTHRRFHKASSTADTEPGESFPGMPVLSPWVAMNQVVRRGEQFVVVSNYGTGGDPRARGRRFATEPSATVTGKISRNRILTLDEREAANPRFSDPEAGQLQTFPADYRWRGGAIAQQIGNAVPPRLGMHVLAAALDIGETELSSALRKYYDY